VKPAWSDAVPPPTARRILEAGAVGADVEG